MGRPAATYPPANIVPAQASAVQSTGLSLLGSTALWQVQADWLGHWIDYSGELSHQVEEAEQSMNSNPIIQTIPGTSNHYRYDVLQRIQTNLNSNTQRAMRRVFIQPVEQQQASERAGTFAERQRESWNSWQGSASAACSTSKAKSKGAPVDQWQTTWQQPGWNWPQRQR